MIQKLEIMMIAALASGGCSNNAPVVDTDAQATDGASGDNGAKPAQCTVSGDGGTLTPVTCPTSSPGCLGWSTGDVADASTPGGECFALEKCANNPTCTCILATPPSAVTDICGPNFGTASFFHCSDGSGNGLQVSCVRP